MLKFSPAKARLRLKSRTKFWSLFRDELLRTCHKTTTVINMTKVFDKKNKNRIRGKLQMGAIAIVNFLMRSLKVSQVDQLILLSHDICMKEKIIC